jgi:hypothetical protein
LSGAGTVWGSASASFFGLSLANVGDGVTRTGASVDWASCDATASADPTALPDGEGSRVDAAGLPDPSASVAVGAEPTWAALAAIAGPEAGAVLASLAPVPALQEARRAVHATTATPTLNTRTPTSTG